MTRAAPVAALALLLLAACGGEEPRAAKPAAPARAPDVPAVPTVPEPPTSAPSDATVIRGVVQDGDGVGVRARVWVRLWRSTPIETGPDGSFEIRDVVGGKAEILATTANTESVEGIPDWIPWIQVKRGDPLVVLTRVRTTDAAFHPDDDR